MGIAGAATYGRASRLRFDRQTAVLLGILIFASALRLAWTLYSQYVPETVPGDEPAYKALAITLASGGGYSHLGLPTAWWVPGWPFYISLIYRALGQADIAVQLANILLADASIVLLFVIGRRAFGDRPALLAAGLFALWPAAIILPDTYLSENLAIPLLLLTAAFAMTKPMSVGRGLAVGVLCGPLVLVREQHLLVPVVIAVYWLLPVSRRTVLPVLALLAGTALILTPWVVRNYETLGLKGLSTSSGLNLYISLHDGANGRYQDVDWQSFPLPEAKSREAAVAAYSRNEAVTWALHNPVRVVALAPVKLGLTVLDERWILYHLRDATGHLHPARGSLSYFLAMAVCQGYWLLMLAFALYAVGRRLQARDSTLLLLVIAAVLLPELVMFGGGRFHASVLPFVLLFAAAGLLRLATRRSVPLRYLQGARFSKAA